MTNSMERILKPTLLLVLVFLLTGAYAQYAWPPEGEEGVDYYINSKEKPDGLHYRTYGDGTLFYIGIFENGKPKSNTEFWYYYEKPAGAPMTLHTITDDPNIIDAVNYYTDGSVMSKGQYHNQKKTGPWKFYSEKGLLTGIETYADDKRNGESRVYYDNGKLYRIENYEDDVKNGTWKEFFKDGKKKIEGAFLNGKMHGEFIYYYTSGRFDITGEYDQGKKHGTWVKYLENGKVHLSTLYKYDQVDKERRENGEFMEYYDNGIPKAEYEYVNMKKHGPFKTYFNKGEWVREPVENDGRGGLQYKETLKGQQVQREGDYVNGLLEGEVTYYSEKGLVTHVETYSEGELVSTTQK